MFNKRKIRKLVMGMLQSSIVLNVCPTLEVHEDLEDALDINFIGRLMEDHFSGVAHDPVILNSIKKSLLVRTDGFVNQLTDIVISEGVVSYCKDTICNECGASVFKIGERYFCKKCYDKKSKETYFKDRRNGSKNENYKFIKERAPESTTEEVSGVREGA